MTKTKNILVGLIAIGFLGCKKKPTIETSNKKIFEKYEIIKTNKIQVLNFATFHMRDTPDANKFDFDASNLENVSMVHAIAKSISEFKPTVIVVEESPEFNEALLSEYKQYVKNPDMKFKNVSEIQLLAYEVGRLSNADRIYGVNHKMRYNYMIGRSVKNQIDSIGYMKFAKQVPSVMKKMNKMSVREKLVFGNSDEALDFAILGNADILTHIGTDGNFEGADEAAKYYHRNLRMYSNLNRISLTNEDRVFILLGGSHTAFFRDFLSRSSKYELVNTDKYLKK